MSAILERDIRKPADASASCHANQEGWEGGCEYDWSLLGEKFVCMYVCVSGILEQNIRKPTRASRAMHAKGGGKGCECGCSLLRKRMGVGRVVRLGAGTAEPRRRESILL
eukprot:365438-Chlamydomonas_euryale.AAC.16